MVEAWVTDADLVAAQRRFAATVPGLVLPAAYAVARADPGGLHFGHVNQPGAVRPLYGRCRPSCWPASAAMWPPRACTVSTVPASVRRSSC